MSDPLRVLDACPSADHDDITEAEAPADPHYWRSLAELARTEEFVDQLGREFPHLASEWPDGPSRRSFLTLMGASLALAGGGGCAYQPPENIVPYAKQPPEIVPGVPNYYATAVTQGGYAVGVLVEAREGRPIRVEGNAAHPASLGAVDPQTQASILGLYDPDRSRVVVRSGRISTWDDFLVALSTLLEAREGKAGGLRILTEAVTSPTLARQIRAVLAAHPGSKWHQYEPVGRHASRAGAAIAFGEMVEPRHDFAKADVIVSLDADFLGLGPARLADARAFAARRETTEFLASMNRLYVAEPSPTITGAKADHRLPIRAGRVAALARAMAVELKIEGATPPADGVLTSSEAAWAVAAAKDLAEHRGGQGLAGLVIVGDGQPPAVHALACLMNQALGNVGRTVSYPAPAEAMPVDPVASLAELVRDIDAGEVDLVVVLGGNPAYSAPAGLDFARKLAKVPMSIRLGLHEDETSTVCRWHINEAHPFESWGDALAFDGTATIQQPLIAPLYQGKSAHELLSSLAGEPDHPALEAVRETWKARFGADFDRAWQVALHDGLVRGSATPAKAVTPRPASAVWDALNALPAAKAEGLELVFQPDPTIHDGRYANNGWLQELPKPITKLTWDNVATIDAATAGRLGVANGDLVAVSVAGRSIEAPAWVMPGQAEGTIGLQLGYGRTRSGVVGIGRGYDANALRAADAPWIASGAEVRPLGRSYPLASTQTERSVQGRDLVREATLADFLAKPAFAKLREQDSEKTETLYPEDIYDSYAWGMSINLNTCIGCNACVTACQSENNIPVIGKDEVAKGRAMHWIQVDSYFQGTAETLDGITFQPRTCMHCEKAPCEVVCPVAATVHDAEGLNNMVYNRCVGTRYCSNNCPYKVRHFNFIHYTDVVKSSLTLLQNPDVTVRWRGVMEKCSYCVQRISGGRIRAKEQDRRIRDGEVKTACQQACPTNAILFGDINDKSSVVAKSKGSPRDYAMLGELNTRPRTTYLAKLTNPNPALAGSGPRPAAE